MKINPNTPEFWDLMNEKNQFKLSDSQIYIHKNKIILGWISIKDKNILNIGVGNGYLEDMVSLKHKCITLSGIDISKLAIRNISRKINGNFKVANIKNIPFKNNLFDSILAIDILEHLTYQELNIGFFEINRVIKKKGKLIISVPLNENLTDKKLNRHLTTFTLQGLSNILTKNNFRVNKYKNLYAFKNFYSIKSLIAKYFNIKKPNLLIIEAIKI